MKPNNTEIYHLALEASLRVSDHVLALGNEHFLRDLTVKFKIKLLPKSHVCFVPIKIGKKSVVLIDDDRLVRIAWKLKLERDHISFNSFEDVQSFIDKSSMFDSNVGIYIDSSLGKEMRGEVEAKKIYELGFRNLNLCTGYQKSEIVQPEWIKNVFGKMPSHLFS